MYNVVNISATANLLLHPGLCGDFNDVESDDFRTTSGLIEGTASIFASTWKMDSSCVDVNNIHDPCTMSIDKGESEAGNQISSFSFHTFTQMLMSCLPVSVESYATHWCSLLSDPQGHFAKCHHDVNPEDYEKVSSHLVICSYVAILQIHGPPADLLILWPGQRLKGHDLGTTLPQTSDSTGSLSLLPS